MYRKIMLTTDGSRLAEKGVAEGLRLARALGARVVGVYVMAPMPAVYGEAASYYAAGFTPREFAKLTREMAAKALDKVSRAARASGVPCATRAVTDAEPWRGILRAARAARCDAIVMGSHGRGSVGTLFLGSETSRVLSQSKLPVLVVR